MKFDVQFSESDTSFDVSPQFENNDMLVGVELDKKVEITNDHTKLTNRELEDQHPIESITDLRKELDERVESSNVLTNLELEELLK